MGFVHHRIKNKEATFRGRGIDPRPQANDRITRAQLFEFSA
jgi:hypothetical protein